MSYHHIIDFHRFSYKFILLQFISHFQMCAQIFGNTQTYQMLRMIFGPKVTTRDLISFATSVTYLDLRIRPMNRNEKEKKVW